MKKLIFIAFLLVGTTSLFGQSQQGSDNQLSAKAVKAAREAGCLAGYNGDLTTQITVTSICFAGGFVTEVLVVPQCHGPECEFVKFGPLAKVTFYCSDENPVVECY